MAGLYVHIPFCHSKCAYCDFFSTPHNHEADNYINAVINEWHQRRNTVAEPIETVYIGGGTPSSLPVPLLEKLIKALPENVVEYTVEANPEDVTPEWVKAINNTPVNRVSMGIQSFIDTELRTVGRRHSARDAERAVENLRAGGIYEISCDLIYGLPGQTIDSWQLSLDRLLEIRPPHLSCYLLSYEKGTRLWAMRETGKVTETCEETALEMYHRLIRSTHLVGYEHYEISNFALPGHYTRHNSSYWLDRPYLGLGVSAHSFNGNQRSYNSNSIKNYITSGGIGNIIIEKENDDERFNDYIITALRTSRGIVMDEAVTRFGQSVTGYLKKIARPHIAAGRMIFTNDTLSIPESQWLVSDRIMTDFMKV